MNQTTQNEPTPPQQTSWTDVAKESAQQPTRELVTDVIDIVLNDSDLADIARANAADDQEKETHQREVDHLKESLKEEKVAIAAIEQRVRDRNNSVRKGSVARKGEWLVVSIFAQNLVQYLDPKSERVVFERPMQSDERQVELALGDALSALKVDDAPAMDDDGTALTDPEALLRAAQAGEEQDDIDLTDEDEDGDES